MTAPGKRIRINADDAGISSGTLKALNDCARNGILNSASVLVNGPYFEQVCELLKKCPWIEPGIHLNLTYGKPLSRPHDVECLAKNTSYIFSHSPAGLFALLSCPLRKKKALEQAETELEAQFSRMADHGLKPVHVDSHRHIHLIPSLAAVIRKVALRFSVRKTRRFVWKQMAWQSLEQLKTLRRSGCARYAALTLLAVTSEIADCSGTQNDGVVRSCCYIDLLEHGSLPAGVKISAGFDETELVCHPGYPLIENSGEFFPGPELSFYLSDARKMETAALTCRRKIQSRA